jgi:probable phosphoglycerate mutase
VELTRSFSGTNGLATHLQRSRASGSRRRSPCERGPEGRTRQTAEALRQFRDYPPPVFDPQLQEVTTGSWDGLTHAEINAGWPGRLDGSTHFDWYFRAPDGESYGVALGRIRVWLQEVNGPTIAVSHALLGRLIRGAYLDLPRAEALCLPVPQDVIWHLRDGDVRAIKA